MLFLSLLLALTSREFDEGSLTEEGLLHGEEPLQRYGGGSGGSEREEEGKEEDERKEAEI